MVLENAPSWQAKLSQEFKKPYMKLLMTFLLDEKDQNKNIYPPQLNWFYALEATPLEKVKVVILGQDPYHQPSQAHGLCFSVQPGIKVPASLLNIYKELATDVNAKVAEHGCLESWTKQGVLLLNAVLTVEGSNANSHQGKGWEIFTDKIINVVNEHCENVVFMLWGNYAQQKGAIIDDKKHLVLRAAHPSPLSAYRGFFGCKHFSEANINLVENGKTAISWNIPSQ